MLGKKTLNSHQDLTDMMTPFLIDLNFFKKIFYLLRKAHIIVAFLSPS